MGVGQLEFVIFDILIASVSVTLAKMCKHDMTVYNDVLGLTGQSTTLTLCVHYSTLDQFKMKCNIVRVNHHWLSICIYTSCSM